MNAPDNIYIVQWPSRQSPGGKWHTEKPVVPHPEWIYQYTRHDKYAAVVAERDELRREVERLKNKITEMSDVHSETLSDVLYFLGDDAPKENGRKRVLFIAEQLRARLDAACEWVPIAAWADLRDGEMVDIYTVGGVRWNDCQFSFASAAFFQRSYVDSKIMVSQVTHIMRIKPPAARGE